MIAALKGKRYAADIKFSMELDKAYLRKLKEPLRRQYGLRVSEYFGHLESNRVSYYEESKQRLSEKFVFHMEYLLSSGRVCGPQPTQSGLAGLGLKVGANRHAVIVDDGLVKLSSVSAHELAVNSLLWLRDHFFAAILTGVALAVLLAWLGIGK